MATILEPVRSDRTAVVVSNGDQGATESAVSWGAIFAGAAAGAALSLILLILGVGLGLSSVSPWAGAGVNPSTFGLSTIAWITFTQLAASALGGYLAGRLRTKWTNAVYDEVHFRDTAHGLLTWAVATLLTAGLLTSTIASIVGAGATTLASAGNATATVAAATAMTDARNPDHAVQATSDYYVDMLFRTDARPTANTGATNSAPVDSASAPAASTAQMAATIAAPAGGAAAPLPLAEVARIIGNGMKSGSLPEDDVHYLGSLVAQRTGLSQEDAERRVGDVFSRLQAAAHDAETTTKAAAESARQASAYGALWLFISLLIGAFVASLAATYGGRQRDL
jgi:hypothetical protein